MSEWIDKMDNLVRDFIDKWSESGAEAPSKTKANGG